MITHFRANNIAELNEGDISMPYETKFTFSENPEMFAAEYLALHLTEGVQREEEEVMYEVLDLIEKKESLDAVFFELTNTSKMYFITVLTAEIQWCEEALTSELHEGTTYYREIATLKEAYEIAVDYLNELSTMQ